MPYLLVGLAVVAGLAVLATQLWLVVELRRTAVILTRIDDKALHISARLARIHAAMERRAGGLKPGAVPVGTSLHDALLAKQRRTGPLTVEFDRSSLVVPRPAVFDQDAGN